MFLALLAFFDQLKKSHGRPILISSLFLSRSAKYGNTIVQQTIKLFHPNGIYISRITSRWVSRLNFKTETFSYTNQIACGCFVVRILCMRERKIWSGSVGTRLSYLHLFLLSFTSFGTFNGVQLK